MSKILTWVVVAAMFGCAAFAFGYGLGREVQETPAPVTTTPSCALIGDGICRTVDRDLNVACYRVNYDRSPPSCVYLPNRP